MWDKIHKYLSQGTRMWDYGFTDKHRENKPMLNFNKPKELIFDFRKNETKTNSLSSSVELWLSR